MRTDSTRSLLLTAALSLVVGCTSDSRDSWNEFTRDGSRVSDPVLRYATYGEGRPVILLHGLGANQYTWRHLGHGLINA